MRGVIFIGQQEEPAVAAKPWWRPDDVIATDSLVVQGQAFRYTVLNPAVAPQVPNFSGMPHGQLDLLFISADLVNHEHPKWHLAVLTHEVICMHLWASDPEHCRKAIDMELNVVPTWEWVEYLQMRDKFYEAVLDTFDATTQTEFVDRIVTAKELVRRRIAYLYHQE